MGVLIAAASLHLPDGSGPGWLEVDDDLGTIASVGRGRPRRDPDEELDGILAPGLIDAQINGAYGADFATATDADWERIVDTLPRTGVTAIVPTFITAPVEDLAEQVREYARQRGRLSGRPGAARLLPAHVEGPFLAEICRGAHRAECLTDPTPELVETLVTAGGEHLGYVTVAPERRGAIAAIERFVAAGVRVSVGHSDADAVTVARAADAGATLVTHLFNAQSPLRHRDPGVVGAALTDSRLTAGLIADLHHVDPIAIRIAFAAADGRIMLVTDNVSAFGMDAGDYLLGGEPLTVRDGRPPLRADGTIAGAAVRLDTCIGNVVREAGVEPATAIDAATRVPAAAIGQPAAGVIEPGAPADLVLLDGSTFAAKRTWIAGREIGTA